MKRAVVVLGGVLAIAAGVWAWQSATNGQACEKWQTTVLEVTHDSSGYATVRDALARFGGSSGLPPESLVPTDVASPEFGATVTSHGPRGREYDLWKDGVVVHSVSLHRYSGGWGVGGYSGCSELGARFK